MKKALLFPYSFVLMNWAVVAALYHFVRGRSQLWNPTGSPVQQRRQRKQQQQQQEVQSRPQP